MSEQIEIEMAESAEVQKTQDTQHSLLKGQQEKESDKSSQQAGEPKILKNIMKNIKNIISISNFFIAMFGVGLNYGIWWTLDDLKLFYDEYNFYEEGKDVRCMVYINICITFVMGLVSTNFTDIRDKCLQYLVSIGGVISMFGLILSCYANNATVLYVTYGFITGIGFGLMLPPSFGLILKHFKGFALEAVLAIAFMVASICLLLVPPLFEYCKVIYGTRSVFAILACLYGQLICILLLLSLLLLLKPPPCDTSCMVNKMKCLKFSLLIKPIIFDMVIAALFIGVGQNIMVLHLKQLATEKGASERDLQLSPFYYGSAMIFGLLCYVIFPPRCKGGEKDNIKLMNLWKFGVSLVAAGVAVIVSIQTNSFGAFFGINIISAAGSGFYLPLMFVLLKAFCKEQDDGNQGQTRTEIEALRFVLPAFGIGALIGLPIGDVLNTNFGDGSSYYLAGVTLISACPLVLVRGNLKWCKRGRELAQDNHEP